MKYGPSWSSYRSPNIQQISRILWTSNVHDGVHKSPPLVSILSQTYTVHAFIFSINNIYFNIIIPPTSRFSRVLPTNSLRISLLLKHAACHMPCPSHYVLCSTNHEAPHRTILSNPCYVLLTNIPYMDIGVNEWVTP